MIIRKTREVGNSAGILLPREWLNKTVSVQLVPLNENSIIKSVIEILIEKGVFQDVLSISLAGSYARDEQSPESDIDILVITNETDKIVTEGLYEITCISKNSLEEGIKRNLYIFSLIKESKPLFNKPLVEFYTAHAKIEKFEFAYKLKEIRKMLNFNKILVENNLLVSSGTVYSVVLRVRELYILTRLLNKKLPTKKQFIYFLGDNKIYKIYENVKNGAKKEEEISSEQVNNVLNKAYSLLSKWEKQKIKRKQ